MKSGEVKLCILDIFVFFGFPVYVHHIGDDKLEVRAYKGILMGYTDGIKRCRIWNPIDRKIFHSRHVTFDEPTTSEESDRSKEMEVVLMFQLGSRVVVDAVEEDAVDGTSQKSPQVPSSSAGDVYESGGSSV